MSLSDILLDTVPKSVAVFFRDSDRRTAFETFTDFFHVMLVDFFTAFLFEQLFELLVGMVETKFDNPVLDKLLKRFR